MSRWLLVLLLLASSGCASASTTGQAEPPAEVASTPPPASPSPGSTAPPPSPKVQAFNAFVDSLRSAKYSDYKPPVSKVDSEAAFEGMRGYLLARYEHVQVPRSFMANGTVHDCMPTTGPATDTGCPAGHAPQRRLTLADLTLYPNLAAFLGKPPGGPRIPNTPPPPQ